MSNVVDTLIIEKDTNTLIYPIKLLNSIFVPKITKTYFFFLTILIILKSYSSLYYSPIWVSFEHLLSTLKYLIHI